MIVKQIYNIKGDQIIIHLPNLFLKRKKVMVILDDDIEQGDDKFELMKKAATDPLFLNDLKEITDDFEAIDKESL